MKGPSEKADQFAVLEYMKGGQMVSPPPKVPRVKDGSNRVPFPVL